MEILELHKHINIEDTGCCSSIDRNLLPIPITLIIFECVITVLCYTYMHTYTQ